MCVREVELDGFALFVLFRAGLDLTFDLVAAPAENGIISVNFAEIDILMSRGVPEDFSATISTSRCLRKER